MSKSNNLVIGSAFGYSVDKIKPFVLSLRKFYDGDILFIVNNLNEELTNFFNQYSIYSYIPQEPLNPHTGNVFRFKWYLECLTENFLNVEHILVTDVRDVVFQDNPFARPPTKSIEFFAEPELFDNCPHNRPWYKSLYDEEGVSKIKNEYVLCAGTTLGKRKEIIFYFQELLKEIDRLSKLGRAFGQCDQAVHNYLVYNGTFSDYQINHNGKGLVSTMHHSKLLTFDRNGRLLNDDGSPIPIVHQYDRCAFMSLNLLRNALDAKGKKGVIECAQYVANHFHEVDL